MDRLYFSQIIQKFPSKKAYILIVYSMKPIACTIDPSARSFAKEKKIIHSIFAAYKDWAKQLKITQIKSLYKQAFRVCFFYFCRIKSERSIEKNLWTGIKWDMQSN